MLRQFVIGLCVFASAPVWAQTATDSALSGLREQIQRQNSTDWLQRYPVTQQPDLRREQMHDDVMRELNSINRQLQYLEQSRTCLRAVC